MRRLRLTKLAIVDDPSLSHAREPPMPLTATAPRRSHFRSLSPHGFHRVVYYEWGDAANARVVVCVHGVGRNGRDFDVLGEALAPTHRVLAIDMPGRGESDWLADPNDYVFPTYLTTLVALIARSGADARRLGRHVDGRTSRHRRRGATGEPDRASRRQRRRARHRAGRARAHPQLFRHQSRFRDLRRDRAATCARSRLPSAAHATRSGSTSTRTNVRQGADGRWRLAYDPGIAVPFRATAAPPDLWPLWDMIRCPTLVLRGAESDLLSRPPRTRWRRADPSPRSSSSPGVGHAPMLLSPEQVDPVVRFLRADAARSAAD